jgi:hypothetical protein
VNIKTANDHTTPGGSVPRRLIASLILVVISWALIFHLVDLAGAQHQYKTDLAQVNDVRYGLLNAEEWVKKAIPIISKKITVINFPDPNKEVVRQIVASTVDQITSAVHITLRSSPGQNPGLIPDLGALFARPADGILGVVDKLSNRVPEFTEIIFQKLNPYAAKDAIQIALIDQLAQIISSNSGAADKAKQKIQEKYHCLSPENCNQLLTDIIDGMQREINLYLAAILVATALLFSLVLLENSNLDKYHMAVLVLACGGLLFGGLVAPMIELEARIAKLSLTVLGETISFSNQVMYYQNKSVLDVVGILLNTGDFRMQLVAVLVTSCSILLPMLKLVMSLVYYSDFRGWRNNRAVGLIALESGKWSMADVMVLAMFMAFIGLDGIVKSQLSQLGPGDGGTLVVTAGGSQLQAGFYLFLGFVISSMVFSEALKCRERREKAHKTH